MKRCFASLFAVGIVATLLVVGCGDSATVSQPDTAPPLAPVVLGARGSDGMVGLWWRGNTEPDLAGYHVYITQAGLTRRMSRYPIQNTYVTWEAEGTESVQTLRHGRRLDRQREQPLGDEDGESFPRRPGQDGRSKGWSTRNSTNPARRALDDPDRIERDGASASSLVVLSSIPPRPQRTRTSRRATVRASSLTRAK